MENMAQDAHEHAMAMKGQDPNESFEDFDNDWFAEPEQVFEPIKTNHDEADIAKQVEAISSKKTLEEMKAKFTTLNEWNEYLENGGEDAIKTEKERILQENFERALAEAKEIEAHGKPIKAENITKEEFKPLDKQTIDEALSLFNSEEEDTEEVWF